MINTLFYLLVLAGVGFDQIIKALVRNGLFVGQTIPIIKNIFHLTYVQNTGAAFGLFANYQLFLMVIVVLVSLVIVYYHFRIRSSDFYQIPLAFILAGSLGNLIDRLHLRYVVDYLDFRFWPVFNLADIMINMGVFLILIKLIFVREENYKSE